MNPLSEYLAQLASLEVNVWREGDNLRCSGPSVAITDEIRTGLAARKPDLLRFLERAQSPIEREFDSRLAWKGADLPSDAGVIPLTPACSVELDALLERLRESSPPLETLHPDDFDLSACRAVLAKAKEQLDQGLGFAVIDRLDLSVMSSEEARSVYWLLASMLERPVPLRWDGTVMRDVSDLGKRSMRAVDTTAGMDYHTDNSFNVCPPHYVSLLCLQKAKEGGVSKLVSFPAVHNEMRRRHPGLLARLYGPYRFNRQAEHAPDAEVTLSRPIFENVEGELATRMSRFHVRTGHALSGKPLDSEGETAMEAMEAIMNEPGTGFEFWFEPGQIQVIDNRRIGHKRTEFSDWPEPERKRCLVRLWLRDSGRPRYNG